MHKLQNPISTEGWSIQVYGSDRRLLCSLYPSHGWMFAAGILVGFAIAISSVNPQQRTTNPTVESPAPTAPVQVD